MHAPTPAAVGPAAMLAAVLLGALLASCAPVVPQYTGFSAGAWSPDGSVLAIGDNYNVLVLDAGDFSVRQRLRHDPAPEGGKPSTLELKTARRYGQGDTLVFLDDRRLASLGMGGAVHVFDITTGGTDLLIPMNMKYDSPISLAWYPEDRKLAVGTRSGVLMLYRVDPGASRRLGVADTHKTEIYALQFSRDGQLLASGARDSSMRLWETERLDPVGSIRLFNTTFDMELLDEGRVVVLRHDLEVWELESREKLDELKKPKMDTHGGQATDVVVTSVALEAAFHILSGGWLIGPMGSTQAHCRPSVAVTPDLGRLAFHLPIKTQVAVIDIAQDELVALLDTGSPTCHVSFDAAGERLLVTTREQAYVFDTQTWQRQVAYPHQAEGSE